MSTIATINSTDLISTSRTDINTNFSNLNTDKMETSVLDTDSSLAANSDSKVATQKATKAYVLANVNPTGASWNEYAADAGATDAYAITLTGLVAYATGQTFKFKANTANTGAASLKVNSLAVIAIKKDVSSDLATGDILANQIVTVIYDGTNMQLVSVMSGVAKTADLPTQNYTVGALSNALVKTYFNIQLPFILWTGSTSGALTTDFANWIVSSTDVTTMPMGSMVDFQNTGADNIYLSTLFYITAGTALKWNATNIIIIDFWAKLPATATGDIGMGFQDSNSRSGVYTNIYSRACFFQRGSTGVVYASTGDGSACTNAVVDLTGITITNWNNYRIEYDLSNNALFYVNGVLKATISTNITAVATAVSIAFARSDTALFDVTAPNLSIQLNP